MATTYTSVGSGAWDTVGTWDNGVTVPGAAADDIVVIATGHAITASASNRVVAAITIVGTGSLTWGATTLTCAAVTLSGAGSFVTGDGALTCTSITTTAANAGVVTIGAGGATFAGVLNNAGTGKLTINGICTGITNLTTRLCDQNAAVTMSGTVTAQTASDVWNINANLTGFTGSIVGAANTVINIAAGVTITTASATDVYITSGSGVSSGLYINGTSGSRVTLAGSGAGKLGISGIGAFYKQVVLRWADISGFVTCGDANTGGYIRCYDCEILKGAAGSYGRYEFYRCFICGAVALGHSYGGMVDAENVAIGYKRDGSASLVTIAFSMGGSTQTANGRVRNCVVNATTVYSPYAGCNRRAKLTIDNLGFITPSMLPGTGSALDLAVVAAGVSKTYYAQPQSNVERSSTNPPSGKTYHARVTPGSLTATYLEAEMEVLVPIQSGDNITVTAKASRSADTSDCADCWIDPEGAWFTGTSAVAWDLTNSATYYALPTCSAANAGGTGAKGTVRVVFRMKEYSAGQYLDIGDVVITCGGKTYNVSMQNWANGMPVVDAPAASGGGPLVGPSALVAA